MGLPPLRNGRGVLGTATVGEDPIYLQSQMPSSRGADAAQFKLVVWRLSLSGRATTRWFRHC